MTAAPSQRFTSSVGIATPVICGAMYPCSNPELVAAASAAGGIGIVQPISLTYVHGYAFRTGLQYIRSLTEKPIGMNALIEQSSRAYRRRMEGWIEAALEEGVRFFVTSLGKPDWVVRRVEPVGGIVYHDVTERHWAAKGVDGGVHGLIAVNNRAGGHAGPLSPEALIGQLAGFGRPVICAGGVATAADYRRALELGYAGVQMGTAFIATEECTAATPYKRAIIDADAGDIVLTERITGVPVSVIRTPFIERMGLTAGPLARWMLRGRRTKHLMRTLYALKSLWQLKRSHTDRRGRREYWQAGKSVAGITRVRSVRDLMDELTGATAPSSSAPDTPTPAPGTAGDASE